MPGGNCVLYGCCSSGRYNVSLFKIPSLRKDESEYTAAIKLKARQEWINVILRNRALTPELKERIEKNKVSFCELHFKPDCILENPTRKGLVTGSVPTENLPLFLGRPRELQLFRPPTKKRKLDNELCKESLKNEDLCAIAVPAKNALPVVNCDENIAPEEPSPGVSKSRRKAPRSQVRKVIKQNVQSEAQLVLTSKTTSKESFQKPEYDETTSKESFQQPKCRETTTKESLQQPKCHETTKESVRQPEYQETTSQESFQQPNSHTSTSKESFEQPECQERQLKNTATKIRVLQTVSSSGAPNVAISEATVIEEDYQRKYFQLLNTMNDLQDKFLVSQRNFEDLVKAREAFIEELKGKLNGNHQEIGSMKQELERSNSRISELEEEGKMYEEKMQSLSTKVEDMKVKESEVKEQVLKNRGDQRTLDMQQDVLEFYKLLTSVTVEKVTEDENEGSQTMYEKFRCSVKTSNTQELQFLLCYDSEFAEVEYTPLALDSVDSSFPEYLKEQIFFESAQAPNFLRRLIQTFQKPEK